MLMVKIVSNAKYFIFTFGILMVVGLVLMGNYDNLSGRVAADVGSVNGVKIPLEEFRQELNNFQEQQKRSMGKTPDGLELVKMRKMLFDFKTRALLMNTVKDQYQLHASSEEMWDYLENNPDPVLQKDSIFQTDGRFDNSKYLNWLHDNSTLELPYMRYMESRMKASIIPENQLQTLLWAQFHQTDLEKAYEEYRRQLKAKIVFYKVSIDSFHVNPEEITTNEIKAFFEANPDSFYAREEAARLGFVQLEIVPSAADSALSIEIIQDLRERVLADSNFDELAISYSDDEGSAENGGSLGGFQSRETWVPEFSKTAFNLREGEISEPVLTQFGYHIIKCNGIEGKDTAKKVDASHILIKIEPTPETVDSLAELMEKLKTQLEQGNTLSSLAEEKNLKYTKTKVFFKWNFAPLGDFNYVPGVHSFAFSTDNKNETVSEVLQNEKAIFLFEKLAYYSPGRSFERTQDHIRDILAQQKKADSAKAELERQKPQILTANPNSLPALLGKAVLDSTAMISPNSWVAGIGFNHVVLNRIFTQKLNEWGDVEVTDQAAVIGRVVEREDKDFDKILESVSGQRPQELKYQITALYDKWLASLQQSAQIENNLDIIYRN